LLIDKTLKEEFIDYTDRLPNNSAWATTINYLDIEKELTGVTKCTFLNNGWVWNIPLYSRIGSGYVYSDKFINDEDALKEFKNYLINKNLDNINFKNEINDLKFKNIKMRVGIHKNTWTKNVAAIGLAAGFIEPLESNGLFTVHEFLFNLVSILKEEKITSWHIHTYNERNRTVYDSFAQFIQAHYALSIRDDSEYWKANSEKKYDFNKINTSNEESAFLFKLYDRKMRTSEVFGSGGFDTGLTCIAIGMNYFILDSVSAKLGEIVSNKNYSELLQDYWDLSDKEKIKWNEFAKQSKTMYNYLKEKYHNDK
jgi:tryptophan halogenase